MKSTSHPAQSLRPLNNTVSLENRLVRYCAAGLGAAAVTAAVTHADAAIVFVDFGNQTLIDTTLGDNTFTLFNVDLDNNGTVDFRLGQRSGDPTGGGAIIVVPTGGTLGVVGISSSGYNYAARLTAGANIGPAAGLLTLSGSGFSGRASMVSGAGFPHSQWASPSPSVGFLGIRFTGAGGLMENAWLRLSIAGNTNPGARAITILGAAYENTGAVIAAGAVPEPTTTSLGLVALGAFGLLAHRKRVASRRSSSAA